MLSLSKPSVLKLRLVEISVIIIFLGLGFTMSLRAPLMEGSDQVAHFEFIRFIAKYGRLPVNVVERSEAGYKSDLPPLFHLLVGLVGSGVDLSSPPLVKLTRDNPRLQLIFGSDDLETVQVLTTEDPYLSEVLLWNLGRWVTLLFGGVGVVVAYLLMQVVYPSNPWLALSAAALLGFTPTYILNSGIISYEPLLGALLAFYFILLLYTIQHPTQNWLYLGLGLLMGLAGLTKYTPVPALPILPLFMIWLIYRKQCSWGTAFWRLILFGLGFTLTFGSWLLFTEIYFNRVAELGWVNGLLGPFLVSDISDETSVRLAGIITGGKLGDISQPGRGDPIFRWVWNFVNGIWRAELLTLAFLGLYGLAMVGLIHQWARIDQRTQAWIILLGAHIGLFMFIPFIRFLSTRQATTAEGHHIFFPAGAVITLLLVQGLSAWLTLHRLTWVFLIATGICLYQSIVLVTQVYTPPWPIRTVPFSDSEPVLATFDKISLIGYEQVLTKEMLQITLNWRAENLLNEDYRIELALLDANGQSQARWLGQPLQGRYPTRAWAVGDRIHDIIYIPVAGLSPGDYQIQLRLLSEVVSIHPSLHPSFFSSFFPLKPILETKDRVSQPFSVEADGLWLDHVTLSSSPPLLSNTVLLNGQEIGYTLWLENRPAVGMPVYSERSTIVFTTRESFKDHLRLSLVGPDGQPHEPIDQTGYIYNFMVEPHFVSGEYHLRFEQWSDAGIVDQVETGPLLRIQTERRQFEVASIADPVMANFAGQIALLGYDLPQRRVQAGGNLPITLHWQALKTMGSNFIMFNHLINEQKELWGGNDRLAHELYSTILWAPGEIVTDSFNVRVNANAPDGIYHLLVGLYLTVGQKALSLSLMQDGQLTDVTHVNIGPIKVGNTPPGFTVNIPNPQNPFNQSLGDIPNLTLIGYDLIDQTDRPRPNLKLTLYWRCEASLTLDYTTFVHIRNSAGEIVAQKDGPPLDGAYPTSLWDPGEIIADEITVPLPTHLPVGKYQIVIGMYDLQTGQRLVVLGNLPNEVKLIDVEIP